MNPILKQLLNFIIILSVQIFLLNDIVIKSSILLFGIPVFIPLIYPLFLLLLPLNTSHWGTLILGFVTGITMDVFSNTPGMHAAACVLLAYMRPYLLNLFFQQNIRDLGNIYPTLFQMGFRSFLLYIGFAVLIHHLFFYSIQIWSFKNILYIILKTVLSSVFSILLIILSQLLFAKREIRRA
ncbi:MAG: rod shape-determining protein MreD [Chitinophagaceae bacterium]|nr:rod shape-determining protein MreD [Chitinophagaceae bacterium]